MKTTIKLHRNSLFTLGMILITFFCAVFVALACMYMILNWNNIVSYVQSGAMLTYVILGIALLVTFFLCSDSMHPLLAKCSEAGLKWSDFAPNSLVRISAVIPGEHHDEGLVIVHSYNPASRYILAEGYAVVTTQNQFNLLAQSGISKGDLVFLSGTGYMGGRLRIKYLKPSGFDLEKCQAEGLKVIDLDSFCILHEEMHAQEHPA